jgi:Xaa-Pro aminopeptidase
MKHAQRMTWQAVERIAQGIRPGMRESEARALGQQVLEALGMQRIWHPTHIRFGANTLKTFKQRSDGDPVLGADDIYFIDMGVVWEGHEGDAGTTFVTGNDPQMIACAAAVKTLFDEVQAHWRSQGVTGIELYDFAAERAREMGWHAEPEIKGHRVSDFPMPSTGPVTWAHSTGSRAKACGSWKSRSPTRSCVRGLPRGPAGLTSRQSLAATCATQSMNTRSRALTWRFGG